jgi:hypothetical protein
VSNDPLIPSVADPAVVFELWKYYFGHRDAAEAITEQKFSSSMAKANAASAEIQKHLKLAKKVITP